MKLSTVIVTLGLLSSLQSVANDGGIAAIKVDSIKMREVTMKDGEEVIVKRISQPSHKIIIEGGEAAKLQKILPSESSVYTYMYPDQAKTYNESFKALGIYSDKSSTASAKIIDISCSDAEIKEDGDHSKIVKLGKSTCVISINTSESDQVSPDYFGDMQTFEPKSCN